MLVTVRIPLTPVAWPKGERPPPVGVMLDFRGLRATHCRLAGVDFTFCDLAGADFEGSSLKGAKVGSCPGARFRNARLQGAEFRGNVSGCDMSGAITEGTDFAHAYCRADDPPLGLAPDALAAIE
ncbi:MAG: pentapeptide repeat-containing protein, partial [Chromatiales bacterium]